jgi:Putative redox-active protein (C_GCAxxG_C_C).
MDLKLNEYESGIMSLFGVKAMKNYEDMIRNRVHDYYWKDDINCVTTVLRILAEIYEIELNPQLIDSAIGLHGAGTFGAQCGLVEGSLMFIGILGKRMGYDIPTITEFCYSFAHDFQIKFGSLVCRELRPQGFSPDNPPHICENITRQAAQFTLDYIGNKMHARIS